MPTESSVAIPDTLPEQLVVISVNFTAPAHPCSVLFYWKMVDALGQLCFPEHHGLYCQVKVVAI